MYIQVVFLTFKILVLGFILGIWHLFEHACSYRAMGLFPLG